MGMIGSLLGAGPAAQTIGAAVGGMAEALVGNRAARDAAGAAALSDAIAEHGGEFALPGGGRFDGFVDGLNRLPRPMLALGTLGLLGYAMAEPGGFATRMQGLGLVPEPLWWLLGAIVSFYFGARELHHQRARSAGLLGRGVAPAARPAPTRAVDPDENAAVEAWRRRRR